jgi:hypothetical protein
VRPANFPFDRITRDAITFFTRGQCMVLAATISELTGLPMIGFEQRGGINHAVIELLPGLYGDVCGVGTYEQHRACNGAGKIIELGAGREALEWTERYYDPEPPIRRLHVPNWEVAGVFAPLVMRMWAGEPVSERNYWGETRTDQERTLMRERVAPALQEAS